jgi:hypothetical protein
MLYTHVLNRGAVGCSSWFGPSSPIEIFLLDELDSFPLMPALVTSINVPVGRPNERSSFLTRDRTTSSPRSALGTVDCTVCIICTCDQAVVAVLSHLLGTDVFAGKPAVATRTRGHRPPYRPHQLWEA